MTELSIPVIDVAALFAGPSGERDRTDEALMAAATTYGFFAAGGLPADVPIDRDGRANLLRVFQLPESEIRPLWQRPSDRAIGRLRALVVNTQRKRRFSLTCIGPLG